MIGRTTSFSFSPGQGDEVASVFQKAMSVVRGHEGCSGFTMLVDPVQCRAVGVHLWETAAHRDAWLSSVERKALLAAVIPLTSSAPEVTDFEVVVHG